MQLLCFGYAYVLQESIAEAYGSQNVTQICFTRYHLGRQTLLELMKPACPVVSQLSCNCGRNGDRIDAAEEVGQVVNCDAAEDLGSTGKSSPVIVVALSTQLGELPFPGKADVLDYGTKMDVMLAIVVNDGGGDAVDCHRNRFCF